jgi:hypothetical protein
VLAGKLCFDNQVYFKKIPPNQADSSNNDRFASLPDRTYRFLYLETACQTPFFRGESAPMVAIISGVIDARWKKPGK